MITYKLMEVTIHTTNLWLDDLMGELSWKDRDQAYQALRVVLHALRDRLPVEAVAALGVQLPPLVRGIYYEGWSPIGKPLMESEKENFLSHIAEAFQNKAEVDPESVVRASASAGYRLERWKHILETPGIADVGVVPADHHAVDRADGPRQGTFQPLLSDRWVGERDHGPGAGTDC